MRVFEAWGDLIRDGLARFKRSWGWVLAQFLGLALLIACGLGWTRIPEKYGWQVALTFLAPLLIAAGFLVLQAGILRGFLRPAPQETEAAADEEQHREPRRVALARGALTLLLWIAVGWILWVWLDRLDQQTYQFAGYMNSKFGLHARGGWASFEKLNRDLEWAVWALRWVVVPGLLIPLGCCSAVWGVVRLPWRRGLRVWADWRWWPVLLACALVGEAWPRTWFDAMPHGTVHAQVWTVVLKVAGAYLLGVACWTKVLGWAAMLVSYVPEAVDEAPMLSRLRNSRRWIGGLVLWMFVSILSDLLHEKYTGSSGETAATVSMAVVLIVAALILTAGTARAMFHEETRRVRFAWGVLSVLVWGAIALGASFGISLVHGSVLPWALSWIALPIVVLPFAIASAQWSFRLPWASVLRVLFDVRWWFGVVLAALAGSALPNLMLAVSVNAPHDWEFWLERLIRDSLFMASAVLLLAWFVILLDRRLFDARQGGFVKLGLEVAPVSLESGPPPEPEPEAAVPDGMVGRPLPKGDEDAGGKA